MFFIEKKGWCGRFLPNITGRGYPPRRTRWSCTGTSRTPRADHDERGDGVARSAHPRPRWARRSDTDHHEGRFPRKSLRTRCKPTSCG